MIKHNQITTLGKFSAATAASLLLALALTHCKDAEPSDSSTSEEVNHPDTSFILEIAEGKFRVKWMADGSFTKAGEDLLELGYLGQNKPNAFALNPQGEFTSPSPRFTLTTFNKQTGKLCLVKPDVSVMVGNPTAGSCVTFADACVYKDWGKLAAPAAAGQEAKCSCQKTAVTVEEFRKAKSFAPLCANDKREPPSSDDAKEEKPDGKKSPDPKAPNQTAEDQFKNLCIQSKGAVVSTSALACKCAGNIPLLPFSAVYSTGSLNKVKLVRHCAVAAKAACTAMQPRAKFNSIENGCLCGTTEVMFNDYYEADYFQTPAFNMACEAKM